MAKSRPLTALQREALLRIAHGSLWGLDARTGRGLRIRGLVVFEQHGSHQLPALTPAGAAIAAEIFFETIARGRARRASNLRLLSTLPRTRTSHV